MVSTLENKISPEYIKHYLPLSSIVIVNTFGLCPVTSPTYPTYVIPEYTVCKIIFVKLDSK
jgi:hypothetical protein